MSKYEEALERFHNLAKRNCDPFYFSTIDKDKSILREAITKAEKYDEITTAKKVIDNKCPSCGSVWVYNSFQHIQYTCCPECGQALDWEEEKK